MTIRSIVNLTAERLREVLDYDPATGSFIWVKRIGIRIVVGRLAGITDHYGHRYIGIDGERFMAHRLAWLYVHGVWPPDQIDHINGIPDDNRLVNLRLSSQAENSKNQRRSRVNTSGYKGVVWHKGAGRWMAQIWADKVKYYLGLFDTPEEGHIAYCEAASRLHREFARFE